MKCHSIPKASCLKSRSGGEVEFRREDISGLAHIKSKWKASGKVCIDRLPLLDWERLLSLSAWLYQEKEEIPLALTLI